MNLVVELLGSQVAHDDQLWALQVASWCPLGPVPQTFMVTDFSM